jgi:phosphoglycerol transferase MdoB-like AlkP superfamily enzyme
MGQGHMNITNETTGRRASWFAASMGVLSCLVFAAAVWFGPARQHEAIQVVFVAVVMAGVLLVILFATARLAFSLMLTGILFLTLSAVAYAKQVFLGNALLISDLYYMTGTSVMETISEYPHLWKMVVGWLLVSVVLLVLSCRYAWRPFERNIGRWRLAVRPIGCACGLLLIAWVLWPKGAFASLYKQSMWTAINQNARLTSFFMSINVLKVRLPHVHDSQQQLEKWNRIADTRVSGGATLLPDIVVVLEESTFDPATLPDCNIPECANHSLIEPNAWTKAHGPMYSYVYGAGTWLSEFDVLTGLPYGIFGSAGGYAPWLLAPRMRDSLPLQLRRQGYRNVAVYPVDGGYFNARKAYQYYGFDAFHGARELKLRAWGASDASIFVAAEQVYETERKRTKQPIFMMILTINQHGPHDNHPLDTLPSPYNKGLFPKLSKEEQLDLSNYLSRLDASDRAMEGLEKFFLDRSHPTVVVSFGDHKPSFSGLMETLKIVPPRGYHGDPKHLTYFKLDANFQTPLLPHYPVTDITFLPTLMIQAANLPRDGYFTASEHLRDVCDGLFASCEDKTVLDSYYGWLFSNHKVFQ